MKELIIKALGGYTRKELYTEKQRSANIIKEYRRKLLKLEALTKK